MPTPTTVLADVIQPDTELITKIPSGIETNNIVGKETENIVITTSEGAHTKIEHETGSIALIPIPGWDAPTGTQARVELTDSSTTDDVRSAVIALVHDLMQKGYIKVS